MDPYYYILLDWIFTFILTPAIALTAVGGFAILLLCPRKKGNDSIHLKIVSLIGRLFSSVKITVFIGNVVAVILALQFTPDDNSRAFAAVVTGNLPLLIPLWAVILTLSVLEFIASARLPARHRRSRDFLIANWIVNFLLLRFALNLFHPLWFVLPVVGCGLYSLHVLVFRRWKAGRQAVLGLAAVLAIYLGMFGIPGTFTHVVDHYAVSYQPSSSWAASEAYLKLEEVLLIQGSPDAETRALCRMLQKEIGRRTKLPCKVRYAGEEAAPSDLSRVLPLIVMRGRPEEQSAESRIKLDFPKIPKKSWGITAQLDKEINFEKLRLQTGNPVFFQIRSATGYHYARYEFNGLSVSESSPKFVVSIWAASGSGDAGLTSRRIARTTAEYLDKRLAEMTARCTLPEIPLPKIPPIPFRVDFLRNPELLYRGHSPGCGAFLVWRFELDGPAASQMERYTEELKKQGFPAIIAGFHREPETKEEIRLIFDDAHHPGGGPAYGLLTYEDRRQESPVYPAEERGRFLENLLKNDPEGFLLMEGLQTLRGEELQQTFARLAAGNPGYEEKKRLLTSTENREAAEQLAGQRRTIFREMVEEALAISGKREFLWRLYALFSLTEKWPEEREFLIAKLPTVYAAASMPENPDENGLYTCKARVRKEPFVPSVLLIDLATPTGENLRSWAALCQEENGRYSFRGGNGETFSGQLREETHMGYYQWYEDSNGPRWALAPRNSVAGIEPGQLIVTTTIRPDEKLYDIEAVFRPPMNWKK